MVISTNPMKNGMSESALPKDKWLNLIIKTPNAKFARAQMTFVIGEERPLPGGLAKGVGKGSPVTPFT